MTTAAQVGRRPQKPPRSRAVLVGFVVFVAITLISVSERWGIGLDLFAIVEDIGRGEEILRQLLDPNWEFLPRVIDPMIETFQIAVIASFIGCGVALPITFFASRTTVPNGAVLTVSRGILSVVRAIPDFLYALCNFYRELNRLEQALDWAVKLSEALPGAPGPRQLVEDLSRQLAGD